MTAPAIPPGTSAPAAPADKRQRLKQKGPSYEGPFLLSSVVENELLAAQVAVVLLAVGAEGDVLAAHLAVHDDSLAAGGERAGEHLEALLEHELPRRDL